MYLYNLRVKSNSSPILSNVVLETVQESEISTKKRKHGNQESKYEDSEPELKKRLTNLPSTEFEGDPELAAAEIMFKKNSNLKNDDLRDERCMGTSPFFRLSPVLVNRDFKFGLHESEGASDVFDLQNES